VPSHDGASSAVDHSIGSQDDESDDDAELEALSDMPVPELPDPVRRRLYASRLNRGSVKPPAKFAPNASQSSVASGDEQCTFEPNLCRRSLDMAERATSSVANGIPRELLLMRYQQDVEVRLKQ